MLTSGNRHHGGSKVSRPQSQHTASNTVNGTISIKTTPMILSAEVIDNDDNGDDDGDNSEQGTSTTQTKTQKSKKKKKMFSLFKRSSKSQQNGEKPNTSPASGMGELEGGTVEDEDEDELSPLPSVNSRNTAVVAPSSNSRLSLSSSSSSSSSSSPAVVVTIGGSNHRAESDSKRMIRLILQPLSHLILALQMNSQYLPEFVQKELFEDFGISCVNIWLLIMNWRSESREEVSSTYTRVFKDWSPVTNELPLIDISSYIIKVKNATMSK